MTNYEWIKSLSVEEMANRIINPCDNFSCVNCHMRNSERKCVLNSKYDGDNSDAIEWLESEVKE